MPDTLADMAGTLGSDAVVPVSPDMMDAASQAAEVSHAATLSQTAGTSRYNWIFLYRSVGRRAYRLSWND